MPSTEGGWRSADSTLCVGADGLADVVIGAPNAGSDANPLDSSGKVFIFLTSKSSRRRGVTWLTEYDADVVILPSRPRGHFGQELLVHASEGMLLVSSPTDRLDGGEGAFGRVWAFNLTHQLQQGGLPGDAPLRLSAQEARVFSIAGEALMGRFGAALAVGRSENRTLLAVSAATLSQDPSCHDMKGCQVGRVWVGAWEDLVAQARGQDVTASHLSWAATIEGLDTFERCGWRLVFGDVDGDGSDELITSAPFAHREAGEVRIFRLRAGAPCSFSTIAADHGAVQRLGVSLAVWRPARDENSDDCYVVAGSPLSPGESGEDMVGRVLAWDCIMAQPDPC
jgi:hypothetical protein